VTVTGRQPACFGRVLLGRFDERDLRIYGAHNRNNPDRQ
jgi:hypothetical protein